MEPTNGDNHVVDEMLLALEANIDYLKQEGNSQLVVRNGTFVNDVGGAFLYEFTLDFLQEIALDTEIEVRIGFQNIPGKVVALNGRNIQVQVDKNFGPTIAEARLIISSYHLLQLLQKKLQATRNGEVQLTDLADKTFGLMDPQVGIDEEYQFRTVHLVERTPPNEYQEKAIRQALGSEVLYIWGPPGTGKTTTIAQIIEGFIEKNMSVLLLAHTNVATDGAFGDFVKLQAQEESLDYKNGKFIRVGDITPTAELSHYEMVRLDVIEQVVGEALRKEIQALEKQIDAIGRGMTEHQIVLSQFAQLDTVNEKAQKLGEEMKKKDDANNYSLQQVENLRMELQNTETAITKYQAKGAIGRFFSTENLPGLMGRKGALLQTINTLEEETAAYEKYYARGEEMGSQLIEEREGLMKKIADKDRATLQKEYEEAKEKMRPIQEQIDILKKQLDEIRAKLIADAKVISTTLTKSYSDKSVLAREYDCIIIDEASMAPLPALWYACGLAKKKVVIVGDFYQLPPVVKHRVLKEKKSKEEVEKEEQLIQKWLKGDIFAFRGISEAITQGKKPPILQQLRIQYRMHPDIADVINELVYRKGGEQFSLISGESTKGNGLALLQKDPLPGAHIGFYDTSEKHPFPAKTDTGSYYNIFHAILCVEFAERALASGYKSVGIITPFRPQANLIQKMLIDKKIDDPVKVDTVHRFQGGQKPIIIFDVVTSQKTMLTDDGNEKGDDEKLINVAFSRAVEKCMVVADVPLLLKKHSPSSLFRKYFDYCSENGHTARSCHGIITEFEERDETEKWLEKIYNADALTDEVVNSALFNETDFYQRFVKDLFEAKKEVVIDSPYITENRMKYFYPVFHQLLEKGIKIFVITRKSTEQNSDNMKFFSENHIQKMADIGVVVLPFKGFVHRKIAVIDRRLVWEGSLNILSQRESGEFMRRIEGEETAKQMMEFLRLDKNIGVLGENHLERCEQCKEPGAWYWNGVGPFGPYTFCLERSHGVGKPPKSEAEKIAKKKEVTKTRKQKKEYNTDGEPLCPVHGLAMIKRKNRWGGEFWGCQRWPRCRIIEKINS